MNFDPWGHPESSRGIKNINMKKLSILIILIAIIGAIFYFSQKKTNVDNQANPNQSQSIAVTFYFSETEQVSFNIKNPTPLSLAEITQNIAGQEKWAYDFKDYGDMGVLVVQIKDKANGQDQKYWQYFVDDEQVQVSVDKYLPPYGSIVEWKFMESEF